MQKKINIVYTSESIALQFFDYFFAWCQSLESEPKYTFSFNNPLDHSHVNVLLLSMPDIESVDIQYLEKFDIVLMDNYGESFEIAGWHWKDFLLSSDNIYFLCGAYLESQHALFHKIISYNHNLVLFTDTISRPFYPQHFQLKRSKSQRLRSHDLIFINGQNRANRQFFLDCIAHNTRSGSITVKNSFQSMPTKLLSCEFESTEDLDFREWLNQNIKIKDLQHHHDMMYYANSRSIGIQGKFGSIPPGYFFIDEYFDYQCVVYPETSWINDLLFLTEKTWKCLVSGAIPWPIAGANHHKMMSDKGFLTALNLLPKEFQTCDSISDHKERYNQHSKALQYAADNPEIWHSDQAQHIRQVNFDRFWINDLNLSGAEKFHEILCCV